MLAELEEVLKKLLPKEHPKTRAEEEQQALAS
jgi:hypothetical protein